MGLNNYQLVLLDNLIYLKPVELYFCKDKLVKVGDMVKEFLEDTSQFKGECLMSEQEWLGILNAIASDDILCNLEIHDIQDNNSDENKSDNGFLAMTLVGTDENIIIFRGTSCGQEWIDKRAGRLFRNYRKSERCAGIM